MTANIDSDTDESLTLSRQQCDLLMAARDRDDPRVVDGEALETVREVLEPAVEQTGVRDPSSLTVEQLAMQLTPPEDAEADTLLQIPETGGIPSETDTDADDEPADAKEALAGLEQDEAHEVRKTLAKSQNLSDRLPSHSDVLKRQAARTLDCEVDDLDALLEDTPSDPRLV